MWFKLRKNYINLQKAAKISGYSSDYIGYLIRKGKIEGKRIYSNASWQVASKEIVKYCRKNNLDIRYCPFLKKKGLSLREAAQILGYTSDYIGCLIRKGRILGKKVYSGLAWSTTEEAIKEYQKKFKIKNQSTKQKILCAAEPINMGSGEKTIIESIQEQPIARLVYDIIPPEKIKEVAREISGLKPYKTKFEKIFAISWRLGLVIILFFLLTGIGPREIFQKITGAFTEEGKTVNFYSTLCDGSWQNPQNAQGEPNVGLDGNFDSFSEANSAVYQGGPLSLICQNFKTNAEQLENNIEQPKTEEQQTQQTEEQQETSEEEIPLEIVPNSGIPMQEETGESQSNPEIPEKEPQPAEPETSNEIPIEPETKPESPTSFFEKVKKLFGFQKTKAQQIPTFEELQDFQIQSAKIKFSFSIGEKKVEFSPLLETPNPEGTPPEIPSLESVTPPKEGIVPEEIPIENPTPNEEELVQPPKETETNPEKQEETIPQPEGTPQEESSPTSFWEKIKEVFGALIAKAQEDISPIETVTPQQEGIVEPTETAENGSPPIETTTPSEEGVLPPTEEGSPPIDTNIKPIDTNENISGDSSNISEELVGSEGEILPNIDAKIIIRYSLDGETWQILDTISSYPLSNFQGGGYFSYDAPFLKDWEDVKNLKIKFEGVVGGETVITAYLDSVWVEANYQEKQEEEEEFELKAIKNIWRADEEPEFEITPINENILEKLSGKISSIFEEAPKVKVTLINPDGQETSLQEGEDFSAQTHSPTKIKIFKSQSFQPGLYKLKITFEKKGKVFEFEQEFRWGVLAINTNKSIYVNTPPINTPENPTNENPTTESSNDNNDLSVDSSNLSDNSVSSSSEVAYIQMAALSDDGHTICNAKLKLEIRDPKLKSTILSTDDETIQYSGKCFGDSVTDIPDYFAYYQVSEMGKYEMKLTNLDNGYEIKDSFEVKESIPFDIERIGPTRIYPLAIYEMKFKIKANQDFTGEIKEYVPVDFEIEGNSETYVNPTFNQNPLLGTDSGLIGRLIKTKPIIWQVDWKAGEVYELEYRFDAPDISPYFYLTGPLKFFNVNQNELPLLIFSEARQWQIAADATSYTQACTRTGVCSCKGGTTHCTSSDPTCFTTTNCSYACPAAGINSSLSSNTCSVGYTGNCSCTVDFYCSGTSCTCTASSNCTYTCTGGYNNCNSSSPGCPCSSTVGPCCSSTTRYYSCSICAGTSCNSCPNASYCSTENCATRTTYDSDGGNYPDTGGYIYDYVGCSGGSCTANTYRDTCYGTPANDLTEYYASGSSYSSQNYTGGTTRYCYNTTNDYFIYCAAGIANCNQDPSDVCEVTLATDPNNCGSCGYVCTNVASTDTDGGNAPYVAGTVTDYIASCSGSACGSNAYADHCAGTNNNDTHEYYNSGTTYAEQIYTNGTSAYCASNRKYDCSAGTANCNQNPSDVCEINTTNDNNNCGSCGNFCGEGYTCISSVCTSTGITVSGTVYSDEAATIWPHCDSSTANISLAVNGAVVQTTHCHTPPDGTYSFTSVTVAADQEVAVFMNATDKGIAATVAKDASTTPITLNPIEGRVWVKEEWTTNITNTLLDNSDKNVTGCTNVPYTVTGTALTVDDTYKIVIETGKTFVPGGNVTTPAMEIMASTATYTAGSNTLILSSAGSGTTCTADAGTMMPLCIVAGGVFTASSDTVQYSAATGTLTVAAATYNNLTLSNSSGTDTAGGNLVVNGTLITTADGTLDMTAAYTLSGTLGTITNNGTISTAVPTTTSATPIPTGKTWGGTIIYAATAGAQTVMAGTYNILTLSNTSLTDTASGAITATTLNTTASGILNMVTYDLGVTNVTNNGTIRTQSLSATPLTTGKSWAGTVQYDATTGGQTVVAGTYNNLTLSNTSGTQTAGGDMTVSNVLTTTASGIFDASSRTITLSGTTGTPFVNGGTFTHSTSTVDYTGANGAANTNVVATDYWNLTLTAADTFDSTASTEVSNVFTIGGSATFDGKDDTLTLSGTGTPFVKTGTFTDSDSTVKYTGNGATNITAATYNNLELSPTIDDNRVYTGAGAIAVGGTLNINPSATAKSLTFNLGGTTSVTGATTIQKSSTATSILDTTGSDHSFTTGSLTIKAGGTLTGNASPLDSNGDVTIEASGTLISTSGNFNVGGSWANSGTFTHSSGTVIFDATTSGKTIVDGGSPFYNITFNGSGGVSEYVFNSDYTYYSSVSSLDSSHFVVSYEDGGNSDYGTAIIGTVSGSDISYGSEYVFNSDGTYDISVSSLDSSHFVVSYIDSGNSGYGTAVIGTVSGSDISYGSEYVFNSADTNNIYVSSLDSSHFVVSYSDEGNSWYGTAIIGTVSGSDISYGSEYVFNSAETDDPSVSSLDSSHFVVSYTDGGNSWYGTAVIGTVSGSDISYGSEYVFNSAETYTSVSSLDSSHFVVSYADEGNSWYGTAIIGTVSGSDISYGSEYVFNSADTWESPVSFLDSSHFVVSYVDDGNSDYGTAIIGTVSGSDISYGSEYVFNSDYTYDISVSSLDSSHFVVSYSDDGNSDYGTAVLGTISGSDISYGSGGWTYQDGCSTAPNQTKVQAGTPTFLNAKTGTVSVTGGELDVDWYLGIHVVDAATLSNIPNIPDGDITISENSGSGLSGWNYRKSHVINSATGAGTNYQVKITVYYGSGSDSGGDIYCNSKCKTDFGDIRFTDDDGTTLLDYWMESKTDSDNAVFWVEVADSLESSNQTIYIYYGKSDATTTSNIKNTAVIGDDFDDGSIDTGLWGTAGTPSESGGNLVLNDTGENTEYIYSLSSFGPYNLALRIKVQHVASNDIRFGLTTPTSSGLWADPFHNPVIAIQLYSDNNFYTDCAGTAGSEVFIEAINTAWHVYDMNWLSGNTNFLQDGTQKRQETGATIIPDEALYVKASDYGNVDWLFLRKYVATEPAHSTWGSEESGGAAASTVWRHNGSVWGSGASSQTTGTGSDGKNPQPTSDGAIRIREYSMTASATCPGAGCTLYKYNLQIAWQSTYGEYDFYADYGGKYLTSSLNTGSGHDEVISSSWYRSTPSSMNNQGPPVAYTCQEGSGDACLNKAPTDGSWYGGMLKGLEVTITGTSINFGTLDDTNDFTAQTQIDNGTTITVTTSATNGYIVTAWETQLMTCSVANCGVETTIKNFTYGEVIECDYADPCVWTTLCKDDSYYCGFGFTSNDDSVEGLNRYGVSGGSGTKYTYFPISSSSPVLVMDSDDPVSGQSYSITYQISASLTQRPGPYTTTIVYIVTAQY
jgi:hypothetical protein